MDTIFILISCAHSVPSPLRNPRRGDPMREQSGLCHSYFHGVQLNDADGFGGQINLFSNRVWLIKLDWRSDTRMRRLVCVRHDLDRLIVQRT